MAFPFWAILITALLPWIAILPGKFSSEFNNAQPRDPNYWSEGFRMRAKGAHDNGFEAFPFFAVSIFVGLGQGGDLLWINKLCGLFLAMRVIYTFCYWFDKPSLRSLSWFVGLCAVIGIFTTPVWS